MNRPDFRGRGGERRGGASDRSEAPRASSTYVVLFDPSKPAKELYDELALKQVECFKAERNRLNANQLRGFFGEVKNLYLEFRKLVLDGNDADRVYHERIEPRFKMVRSKAAYAGGKHQSPIPTFFAEFLKQSIAKVQKAEEFEKFVLHFEAVVGFMYGEGVVAKK